MEPREQPKAAVSAAHHSTAQCFGAFGQVQQSLASGPVELSNLISKDALSDEVGRFRVWSANIGALQKGHSSLDYRLRESHLVYETVLKLLKELFDCLQETNLVLSGTRLPYERQDRIEIEDSDGSNDSSDEISEAESGDATPQTTTELQQRFLSIIEIIDTLYTISRFIRAPALEARISKANSYQKVDKDTSIDLFSGLLSVDKDTVYHGSSQILSFDLSYVIDTICELRRLSPNSHLTKDTELNQKYHVTVIGNFLRKYPAKFLEDDDYICSIKKDPRVLRIARSITRRRQQFQYWSSHRSKLGLASTNHFVQFSMRQKDKKNENDRTTATGSHGGLKSKGDRLSASEVALTETTATVAGPITMTPSDNQSNASRATTARGLDGLAVDLPPLPKSIIPGKDFECPYCFVICPSRTHLLRDLRPYICTYEHCPDSDQRFATRSEWHHHEEWMHRRVWQCPEHNYAKYRSRKELESHLQSSEHIFNHSLSQDQICDTCQIVDSDNRRSCFLCCSEFENSADLQKHVAFHLEKFSAFALPRTVELMKEDDQSIENVSGKDSGEALGGSNITDELEGIQRNAWGTLVATADATLKTVEEIWTSPHDPPRRRNFSLLSLDKILKDIQNMDPPHELMDSEEFCEAIDNSIAALQRIQNEEIRLGENISPEEKQRSQNQIEDDVNVLSRLMNMISMSPPIASSGRAMTRIAIAGSGGLAQIFAQYLSETVHPFIIFSREDQPSLIARGYQIAVVDYDSQDDLRYTLRGIDLVISTIVGVPQINLIDASAHSGVHRFVPAEFEGPPARRAANDPLDCGRRASIDRLRHWANHPRHRMRFTIFSCGVFYERFANGGLATLKIGASTGVQMEGSYLMNIRLGTAEIVEKTISEQPINICLTSVYDVARFIVAALELGHNTWPGEFRMNGDRRTIPEILHWAEAARGSMGPQKVLRSPNKKTFLLTDTVEMFSTSIIEPQDLAAHLQHATYYHDVAKVARIQQLIATEQRRYDFIMPNLNPLVNFAPISFWNWLVAQWGTPVINGQAVNAAEVSERPLVPNAGSGVEGPSSAPRINEL
ncbi:hypothetical protein LARI1_G003446 [Lachnellula arida]|uniref:C2H2-type domain-containing protein n=1 Tax=Lachnellula arida TaxID=1316785 RepID=A0A8T9BM30_9HELO|nr:hypothetical protein LARI1_G003446 [Lachnellula arida]